MNVLRKLALTALLVAAPWLVFAQQPLGTAGVVLAGTTISSTQTGEWFTSFNGQHCYFYVNVTACTGCNMTFTVEGFEPTLNDLAVRFLSAGTAITATGAYRYAISLGSGSGSTTFAASASQKCPYKLRAVMVWNSGTSASFSTTAWSEK